MGIGLLKYRNKGNWNAFTYDQVSRLVQYKWGQQVIKWRKWTGNEVVMDAGCGSGLLTKQLAKQVPRGKPTHTGSRCEVTEFSLVICICWSLNYAHKHSHYEVL